MDLWVIVGLLQHLNEPMHGSFAFVIYFRIEWWVNSHVLFQLTQ